MCMEYTCVYIAWNLVVGALLMGASTPATPPPLRSHACGLDIHVGHSIESDLQILRSQKGSNATRP